MDISAVIPTRNRAASLHRLLHSLATQEYRLKEIIIIDSSDSPLLDAELSSKYPDLNIIYQTSIASACIQRNKGIRLATASHIFVCPDDLEVPTGYFTALIRFFESNPEAGAASGLCFEPDENGALQNTFPTMRVRNLLWNFIFQLTVWADIRNIKTNLFSAPLLFLLQLFYQWKGNTYSLAGWPLVTQIDEPKFRTSLFSLGGSVIRRDWLLQSPYDETLDQYGIGDNYGVTLGFPQPQPVWVNTDVYVIHHKSPENRLTKPTTYLRRVLALHYFMTTSGKFSFLNRIFLLWSLVGNFLYQLIKNEKEMRRATTKAFTSILTGCNPYLLARKNTSALSSKNSKIKSRLRSLLHRMIYKLYYQRALERTQYTAVAGFNLEIQPSVMHPRFFKSGVLFAEFLSERDFSKRSVLDMGTGSGILALVAASRGANVVAADFNPTAIVCAKRNAEQNNLADSITFVEGNYFSGINGGQRFGSILFNPPFLKGKPSQGISLALYGGEELQLLTPFFEQARTYLQPNGSILLFLSSDADMRYFHTIFTQYRFHYHISYCKKTFFETFFVYELLPA